MADDALIQESARGLVEWFTSTAQSGEEFIIEQAPLYAQEVVAWAFWSNVVTFAVALLVMAALLAVGFAGLLKAKSGNEVDGGIMAMVGFGFAIVPIVIGSEAVFSAVQAHVAPRVVILEHVQGLL